MANPNPRSEAYASQREAEAAVKCIPDAVTVGAIEQVRNTMAAMIAANRRSLEWMDAIETP